MWKAGTVAVAAGVLGLSPIAAPRAVAQGMDGGPPRPPADAQGWQSDIAVREASLRELDESIAWIDYVLKRADAGDVIIENRGGLGLDDETLLIPINSDFVVRALRAQVAEGRLTAEGAAKALLGLARDTGRYKASLRGQRARLVARRDQTREALARLRTRPLQPWELGRPPAGGAPPASGPPAPRRETQASANGCDGFVGTWNTNYGPMWIGGSEGAINGGYEWTGAGGHRTDTLSGSVSGNTATGTYSQPGYYDPQWASGRFTFTLSSDGQSWSGSGTNADGSASMGWNGTCAGAPTPRTYTDAPKN